ncbi:MAG: DUF2848 family protein, partial [Actinomycetes bacterium]
LTDVEDHLDEIRLRAWVTHDDGPEELIQDSPLSALLAPSYWLKEHAELLVPGTVLLSGTVAMVPGVDQFATRWRAEMADPVSGETIGLSYAVRRMPEPIG